jgi:hypothetical protein
MQNRPFARLAKGAVEARSDTQERPGSRQMDEPSSLQWRQKGQDEACSTGTLFSNGAKKMRTRNMLK